MKLKRYFVILWILTISIALFSACGFSEKAKYESRGKKNAVQYIEDKYGFKPTVKDVKAQITSNSPIPFSTPSATGYVYVRMKYEDKEFYVFISGVSENTDGCDNYQVNLIENAICEKLNDMVTNIITIDFCLGNWGDLSDEPYYGMFSKKYDGDNLQEVLDSVKFNQVIISLADSDISGITQELIQENFGSKAEYLFVNYKSKEDYEKAENTTYGLSSYSLSRDIEKNDVYIVEYKDF